MKLDQDVEFMEHVVLKAELRKARNAIRKFLVADGNDMCHENRVELGSVLPEKLDILVKPLPFFRFMMNCLRYRTGLSKDS